ncbi:MAG: AAA family ATPase [Clostridia bacterium]
MQNIIVRLNEIELKKFKNVEYGKIYLNKEIDLDKTDIIGIYGQNGSGKTAVIEAVDILKNILLGKELPADIVKYININSEYSDLKFNIYIENIKEKTDNKLKIEYYIRLSKINESEAYISKEKITYSSFAEDKWSFKKVLVEYVEENITFGTKEKNSSLHQADLKNNITLKVAKELAKEKKTSYIFNQYIINLVTSLRSINKKLWKDTYNIILSLQSYAKTDLYVIKNNHSGAISMNIAIPMVFRVKEKEKYITTGSLIVDLENKSYVDNNYITVLETVIEQINKVIVKVVPGLNIAIEKYGTQINKEGKEETIMELVSIKNNARIPLKYESEGIKKIISIMSIIIFVYNNPSACLVVDELDSGIYEFLLGEILQILNESGKGQLIFTSHNLRPLEVLNKKQLYFTTVNPKNRYITLGSIKATNNIRDVYLRSVNLGGQKEPIYDETNNLEIARALRLAGGVTL